MRHLLAFALCFVSLHAAEALAADTPKPAALPAAEEQRKHELQDRLCKEKSLNCESVTSLFQDPRLTIYTPPQPTAQPVVKERERNPYLTKRFGLLAAESLERCRSFIQAHALAFDAAYEKYRVPKEIICGHLRIETNFGMPTRLSPNPFGQRSAFNQLVTLYVRKPAVKKQGPWFTKRQNFAVAEMRYLISAAQKFGWDLFDVPGSPTGAIGLAQFEPSSFSVAVDSNGDGKIDLFDGDDAILSIAHYLVTRGWDRSLEHQRRAIYAYYGGNYNQDPNKYYMRAVLKYAAEVQTYVKNHPVETEATAVHESPAVQ